MSERVAPSTRSARATSAAEATWACTPSKRAAVSARPVPTGAGAVSR
ncbi:hypothetical protein [Streptomyces sp. NPDC088762]